MWGPGGLRWHWTQEMVLIMLLEEGGKQRESSGGWFHTLISSASLVPCLGGSEWHSSETTYLYSFVMSVSKELYQPRKRISEWWGTVGSYLCLL